MPRDFMRDVVITFAVFMAAIFAGMFHFWLLRHPPELPAGAVGEAQEVGIMDATHDYHPSWSTVATQTFPPACTCTTWAATTSTWTLAVPAESFTTEQRP